MFYVIFFLCVLASTSYIGFKRYKRSKQLRISCNDEWTFVVLKPYAVIEKADLQGFRLLKDVPDASGSLPAVRIADGEYVCIFASDIFRSEVRR